MTADTLRAPLRRAWPRMRVNVAGVVARARGRRLHAAVPAVAGAGLVSAGVALRFGVWAGLITGGLFCLRLDSRL